MTDFSKVSKKQNCLFIISMNSTFLHTAVLLQHSVQDFYRVHRFYACAV